MSSLYQKHFPNRHLKIEYLVLVLVEGDHSIAQHMLQGPNRNFLKTDLKLIRGSRDWGLIDLELN